MYIVKIFNFSEHLSFKNKRHASLVLVRTLFHWKMIASDLYETLREE